MVKVSGIHHPEFPEPTYADANPAATPAASTIHAVTLSSARPRGRYCASSANSRLRQPDTFWTRHPGVITNNNQLVQFRGVDFLGWTRASHNFEVDLRRVRIIPFRNVREEGLVQEEAGYAG
jgi:hypothetical protein